MLMAEHKHLAEQGVELVELRLDYIRRPVNLKRLLDERHCPVVATCRRVQEGGRWQRTEEDRLYLLRTAIADGADYVDLELDIAGKIPRYGTTKRIVSYHNFYETPTNLAEIHEKMAECDPDIIKIATMANDPLDNFKTLHICQTKNSIPTVAFCMGEMGLPSRILCGRFGSPMTYATFNEDRLLAPGMLTYKQMMEEYHYNEINEETKILGVIGDPLGHSLSPLVHNACIRAAGLNIVYLPFRVPEEMLDEFLERSRRIHLNGLSVTIPHKEQILSNIQHLDDNVIGIRAANTVVYRGERAYGYNTDCEAAVESLSTTLEQHEPSENGKPLRDKTVLVLGAGGAARAVGFGMHDAGAKVFICARDYRKATSLASHLGCKSLDWPARQNFDLDVLINCTPVGMHPNLDEAPFEKSWLNRKMTVFDCVYNPEQTLLIKYARQVGCVVVTGVDMFVRQAKDQFKHFTGLDADMDLIRDLVKKSLSAAKY